MRTEEKENYIRENLTHHLPTLTALKNLKKKILPYLNVVVAIL
jgi:hypothetical protein